MDGYRILHLCSVIGQSSFGLGQISVNLARAQFRLGHHVAIWCLDSEENISWAAKTHDFPKERITRFGHVGSRGVWWSPSMSRHAGREAGGSFEIVHQHGIWTDVSRATLLFGKRAKTRTIIAPHGSLNQWALDISPWKKKLALFLFERNNLMGASCLHATSENEIADFRDFGLRNPIAYIENGVQEKSAFEKGNADRFRARNSIRPDKRILLFLSRISPKKGLRMLVEAIQAMRQDFIGWQLVIAGNDELNHKAEILSLIRRLGLEEVIKIVGPQFDQAKADAFVAAEVLVLPSLSEGSPMVVLESLAAGVPVITTRASTWRDLAGYDCGWWTDISLSGITAALREAVGKSIAELQQMGKNGKMLVESKYTWSSLARKTTNLYDWLSLKIDKPDFIFLD